MTSTIDASFIEQYNSLLHVRYQNFGFLYRGMTREGTVQGKRVYWQRFGSFVAGDKPRNGTVPLQDPEHTRVYADMADKYVGSLIDDLDMMKQNIAEMQAHVNGQMYALGREFDSRIRAVIDAGATSDIGPGSGVALTVDHMNLVPQTLILAEAPMDGRCFAAVGPRTWSSMMKVDEFVNADYVGSADLPYAGGMTAKMWRGIMWFTDSVIGTDTAYYDSGTGVEKNLIWHQDAVGHGVNSEPKSTPSWENPYQAHMIVSSMSTGAEVIEPLGVYEWSVDTNA